jgi:hypothetical protein
MTYAVHIIAGTLSFLFGFAALYSAKGATLHRKSGMAFVYAMLVMAVFGMAMAALRDKAPAINLPMGALTSYLVITSLATVRPPATRSRWLDVGAMVTALAVGAAYLTFGLQVVDGTRKGMPAFPFFLFGTVSLLAAAGDVRVIRSGPLKGASRLARHLWRMSFALAVAALSFGIQMTKFIPKEYRVRGLLVLPVLIVLATMVYWLWRVRIRRSFRGIFVGVSVPRPAS